MRPSVRRILWLVLLAPVTGCAILANPSKPTYRSPADRRETLPAGGYQDFTGVLHIHTRYSDGAGTFEEIARIANAQGLDYLVVTDHNTLQPLRDGKQGWHGATLVLVGMEISTPGGHYLALNVTEELNRHKHTTQEIIDEVNRQGGLGFIAHPYFQKRRWTDWSVTGYTGVEAYNVAHDAIDENKMRIALWGLAAPATPFYFSMIDRPYDPLRTWDELIKRHGRVAGIGSSDAHEVRLFGVKFAPYEIMFQLSRTHVLVPSTTLTAEGVYDALQQGHAYFTMELEAEAKGFSFTAERGRERLGIMGDSMPLEPGMHLTVRLPQAGQIALFKDGRQAAAATTQEWDVPVTDSGVYRVEVTRHGRPWIFSNPIYVMPDQEPADLKR